MLFTLMIAEPSYVALKENRPLSFVTEDMPKGNKVTVAPSTGRFVLLSKMLPPIATCDIAGNDDKKKIMLSESRYMMKWKFSGNKTVGKPFNVKSILTAK